MARTHKIIGNEVTLNWDYLPGEVAESCEWTKSGWKFQPKGCEPIFFDDEPEMLSNACRHFGYGGIDDALESMRRL